MAAGPGLSEPTPEQKTGGFFPGCVRPTVLFDRKQFLFEPKNNKSHFFFVSKVFQGQRVFMFSSRGIIKK